MDYDYYGYDAYNYQPEGLVPGEGGGDYHWEQPIFTTKAHVFQIDPKTKKNWLPASPAAINVSFYYDSSRSSYRIISVDGSKAVINSTVTPNMTFTKTSQKFGQWSDPRANTVYGLGFPTEADLSKFIEKFKEVKELTRQVQIQQQQQQQQQKTPVHTNGTSSENHVGGPESTSTPNHSRTGSSSSMQNDSMLEKRNSSSSLPSNPTEAQLKYENDRLKIALAQSSANAKKWEIELQTLKNNNARLTTALQESTANVEEWKKQLAAYKEESAKLKKTVLEMEKNESNSESAQALQKQVKDMTDRLKSMDVNSRDKDTEIHELQKQLSDAQSYKAQHDKLLERLKASDSEKESLRSRLHEAEKKINSLQDGHQREKEDVLQLQDQLGSKITELYEMHEQITAKLSQT